MAANDAPGYIDDKDDLLKRLRRIRGQVGGLERMVDEEQPCVDILTQVAAARAALDGLAIALLDDHARHCMLEASEGTREARAAEMMEAVGRLLKSR